MVQIKKLVAIAFLSFYCVAMYGNTTFRFAANSIAAGDFKTKMESNLSSLLTDIDNAAKSGTPLDLSDVKIEEDAAERLEALWEDLPFHCDDPVVVSRCLEDFQGYQVRGIPVTVKPADDSYDRSLNRELTVSLNKSGIITGVRFAMEKQEDVNTMMRSGSGVADVRQRREILKWVEDFRSYYDEKNIKSLDQIFSDDALIITGSVVLQSSRDNDLGFRMEEKVKYKVQSKSEYIKNLTRVFSNNSKINVKFDHISVMKHGVNPNIYGVTLHQTWNSGNYHDEGWLFLLWDFTVPERPQIHVRTWQTDQLVAKEGKFSLDDFLIQ